MFIALNILRKDSILRRKSRRNYTEKCSWKDWILFTRILLWI